LIPGAGLCLVWRLVAVFRWPPHQKTALLLPAGLGSWVSPPRLTPSRTNQTHTTPQLRLYWRSHDRQTICPELPAMLVGLRIHILPSRTRADPHNTATSAVLTPSRPPNYLPGAPAARCSSVCAYLRGRSSLPSSPTSSGSWVPPSRLPSRTRPTRLHGCTDLRAA
jgi:hypothetical protein